MKYFTVSTAGDECNLGPFSTKAAVIRALERLPNLEGVIVTRWWWVRDDLVETEDYPIGVFRATKASDLRRGATAQWVAARGQL